MKIHLRVINQASSAKAKYKTQLKQNEIQRKKCNLFIYLFTQPTNHSVKAKYKMQLKQNDIQR